MLINSNQVTETGTVTELISLAQAKLHLRVDITDDDALITSLIIAARMHAESSTGRSFAQHTYRADIPCFADIMILPWRPIQSISSIKYYNTDSPEALTTVDSAVYDLYSNAVVRRYGNDWPTAWAIRPDAVQITYVTGYLDNASPQVAALPDTVRSAMYLMIGDLYENREGQSGSRQLVENPTGDRLLQPYRVYL